MSIIFSPPLNTKGKVSCIYGEKIKKQEKTPPKGGAVLYTKDVEAKEEF